MIRPSLSRQSWTCKVAVATEVRIRRKMVLLLVGRTVRRAVRSPRSAGLRVFFLLALSSTIAFAQTGGGEEIYRRQLFDLHTQAIAMLDRVQKDDPHGGILSQTELDMKKANLALAKLVTQLGLETGQAQLRIGEQVSKSLAEQKNPELFDRMEREYARRLRPFGMVIIASGEISNMLEALDAYMETGDPVFLVHAKVNNSLVWSIRRRLESH
jgi:hypothetical protein